VLHLKWKDGSGASLDGLTVEAGASIGLALVVASPAAATAQVARSPALIERIPGTELAGAASEREIAALRRRVRVIFQRHYLLRSLTVLQNIQVPMREHLELPQAMMDDLAFLKLTMVGLPPTAAHKFPSELSGGMRKRAGLARALALDPEIVFLDEPTAGLDPIGASDFDHLIRKLQQTLGLTVYMVTHDLDTIFTVCDRVAVLADKKIVRTGSPTELQRQPNHPWIKEYFCGERARAASPGERPKILA